MPATSEMSIGRETQFKSDGNAKGVSSKGSSSERDHPTINVAANERILSLLGGVALTLLGLRRRTTFGAILAAAGGSMAYRGSTGHCPIYAALGTNSASKMPSSEEFNDHGVHVEQAVSILKPAEELYAFWRKFENLPRFMHHLKSVKVTDAKHSHWVAKAPAGREVEWDAEIINDEPNKLIAWRSLENADVHSTGSVRFVEAPIGRGTEVRVTLEYLPPAGQIGRWIAKLFGEEPDQQVREDLRHFKQFMEAGEIATTKGQPAAR